MSRRQDEVVLRVYRVIILYIRATSMPVCMRDVVLDSVSEKKKKIKNMWLQAIRCTNKHRTHIMHNMENRFLSLNVCNELVPFKS